MAPRTKIRPDPHTRGKTAARANHGLIIARAGRCLSVALARPRLNAEAAARLIAIAEEVEDDERILMLAVTGAGTKFCTGFEDDVDGRVVESLAVLSKPTLAIINGEALDEGLELALALDIRVAAAKARFALTHLRRGLMPRFGATQRLPRIIGPAAALSMILTGTAIDASEAARLGLVTRLAAGRAALGRAADEAVRAIVSRGPLAARMAKEAVLKGYDMTLVQGIRLEEDLYALLQTTRDRAEGVRAFLEKRKPLFKGA